MKTLVTIPLLLAASLNALAQDDRRQELLASPKYAEATVAPEFRDMTSAEVEDALLVVSSRSFAVFGFNNPKVQLHLPDVDNTTYAEIEMKPPLLDGADDYELERGLFDAETRVAEIRFLAADGSGPAVFSRAVGEIRLRYPLAVHTRVVAAARGDEDVTIDGPFVEYVDEALAAAPAFSPLEPVRAFDADGRQLERAPYSGSRYENGRSYERLAFHGPVARVEVDSVARWIDVVISYDLPAAPRLPEARAGLAPDADQPVEATHGGKVTVELGAPYEVGAAVVAAATSATAAASAAGLSDSAQMIAKGIDALVAVIPQPPAIVQLVVFDRGVVTISVDVGDDRVEEYMYSKGAITGPKPVVTTWLDCKTGMPPEALDLERLSALWDDAPIRAGAPDGKVLQIVVGQYPCGTAFVNVPVEGAGGVQYNGDGTFVKVN